MSKPNQNNFILPQITSNLSTSNSDAISLSNSLSKSRINNNVYNSSSYNGFPNIQRKTKQHMTKDFNNYIPFSITNKKKNKKQSNYWSVYIDYDNHEPKYSSNVSVYFKFLNILNRN